MAILTRELILAAAASRELLKRETLDIPELGGEVILQAMTGTERDDWEQSIVRRKGARLDYRLDNVRARLVVRCLRNESGERLLTDADADALGCLSASILNRIYEKAQRLNGISNGDVDELKKSSETADGSDSL